MYVTQNYVHLSTRIERIALISEVNSLGIISAVLGELFRARSSFQAEEYIIRLFLQTKVEGRRAVEELKEYFPKRATTISDNLVLPTTSLTWSASWLEKELRDKFEFEADSEKIVLRYARRCEARKFNSFNDFVSAAEIGQLLRKIRDFSEPLIADR